MTKADMKDFLKESYYCNFTHPDIASKAKSFKNISKDEVELAKHLFYFVRDSTVYTIGNWTKRASETLAIGRGTCTNNANLLVALLRSVGIPAGYGVMHVSGPDYFGPVILPHLARNIAKKSKHIYCYVHLNGKWLKCDPSDDEPLSVNTMHLNPQSTVVEWNGLTDAMLSLHPSHVLSDEGPISDIDNIIGKKPRFSKKIPVYIGNIYIQFLREEGKTVTELSQLEPSFERWLSKKHFFIYLMYRTFFFFQNIMVNEGKAVAFQPEP